MASVIALAHALGPWASQMAARAFQNDPMGRYLIPDDADRLRLTPRLFAMIVRFAMRYGHVETTDDLLGLAVWIRPEYAKMTFWQMLRGGLIWAPLRLGPSPFGRLLKAMATTANLHKRAAPQNPHWYLHLLAVDPQHQRKGIGGMLLRHGLARADADGLPCYLETTNSPNVAYYQRHGFETVLQAEIPRAGFTLSAMLREPAKASLG